MANYNRKRRCDSEDDLINDLDDDSEYVIDNVVSYGNKNPPKKPVKKPITPPVKKPKKDNKDDDDNDDDDELDKMLNIFFLPFVQPHTGGGGGGGGGCNPPKTPATPNDDIQCNNKLCDHMSFDEDPTPVPVIEIQNIRDINDLIRLGKSYHCKKNTSYNGLNLRILCNLVMPLTELGNMIGLQNVKTHIVDQILFFLRGYNKNTRCNKCVDCTYNLPCAKNLDDMLHTVITGPPGCGKTELGKILAKVYKEMGVLSKGHFKLVTRSDLIGKYLGHTAQMTQEAINKSIGGVMFIDEAYALGHSEGRDSFSKECIDTLNQNLSEKRDFLCIIAGYKDALEKCFFAMNDGLRRRFTFRYDIEGYSADELMRIFLSKVDAGCWEMDDDNRLSNFFETNKDNFPNYGGDIETLFLNAKIAHCRKIDHTSVSNNRVLSVEDVEDGMKMFASFRQVKESNLPPPSMYLP